jgi:hypothetical protein
MKIRVIWAAFIFAIVFILAIASRVIDNTYLLRIAQVLGLGGLVTTYTYRTHHIKLIIWSFILLFLFLIKIFLYDEIYMTGLFIISVTGSGLIYFDLLEKSPKTFLRVVVFVSWIVILYVFFMISVLGIDSNEVIRGSRNYITTLLLALSSGILIALRSVDARNTIRFCSYVAILCMALITFLYTGRTGVVLSISLLFLTFIHIFSPGLKFSSLLFSTVVTTIVLGVSYLLNLHEMSGGWVRTQEEEIAGVRTIVWGIAAGYMLEPAYFMGVPEGFWEQLTGYSSHNSFIYTYSHVGWVGLLIILTVIIYNTAVLIKKDKIVGGVFLLIVARSFFDLTLLSTDLGPLFVLCILLANRNNYE